jgi:transcriptional regulator with XRE-family HTH domain
MTADDLKTWRTRMKWTQKQAALNLGITTRHYKKLEHGAPISRVIFLATHDLLQFKKNRVYFTT